jgi:cytidine deaminase
VSAAAIDWAALEQAALEAQAQAHAPYSGYRVGAALQVADGRVFAGCNVENASYGLSICAERTAVVHMVLAGARAPVAIAIVTPGPSPGTPCGMCRQTLVEFASDMPVRLMAGDDPSVRRDTTLAALLPDAFRPGALGVPDP